MKPNAWYYYDTIAKQFPGHLVERLGLDLRLDGDPFLLHGRLHITEAKRGINLMVTLQPMVVGGVTINVKVPEKIVLHLCAIV